jgi:hypothetical protein
MGRLGSSLLRDANGNVIQGPVGFQIEDATETPYAQRSPVSVTSSTAVGLKIPACAFALEFLSTQNVYISSESNVSSTSGMLIAANVKTRIPVLAGDSGYVYFIAASTTASVSFMFTSTCGKLIQRNSWKLNGTTQYATLPATLMSPATTGAWAIAFWIRPNAVNVTKPIFSKCAASSPVAGFDIWQVNATIRVRTYKAGPTTETSVSQATILVANQWHHVVISKAAGNASAIVIFVDGVATTNGTAGSHTTAPDETASLVVGNVTTDFFAGKISGIRTFSTEVAVADALLLKAFTEATTATIESKFLARESMALGATVPAVAVDSVAAANGTFGAAAYDMFDPTIPVIGS